MWELVDKVGRSESLSIAFVVGPKLVSVLNYIKLSQIESEEIDSPSDRKQYIITFVHN